VALAAQEYGAKPTFGRPRAYLRLRAASQS